MVRSLEAGGQEGRDGGGKSIQTKRERVQWQQLAASGPECRVAHICKSPPTAHCGECTVYTSTASAAINSFFLSVINSENGRKLVKIGK